MTSRVQNNEVDFLELKMPIFMIQCNYNSQHGMQANF